MPMELFDLTGKFALVTGAARGMGRAMAQALYDHGATVALVGLHETVKETCEQIDPTGERALPFVADLARREEIDRVFDEVLSTFNGRLDILVNNAGINLRHPPEEFPLEDWDQVMRLNLDAVFILAQKAGQVMLRQGAGKIINMASLTSFFGGTTIPAYTAAKGAVAQLTKALSNDWRGKGICVNAIAPGYIATDMNTALINNPERSRKIMDRLPCKEWGKPEDMMGPVVFLASAASDYVSGHVLVVDGGYMGM